MPNISESVIRVGGKLSAEAVQRLLAEIDFRQAVIEQQLVLLQAENEALRKDADLGKSMRNLFDGLRREQTFSLSLGRDENGAYWAQLLTVDDIPVHQNGRECYASAAEAIAAAIAGNGGIGR